MVSQLLVILFGFRSKDIQEKLLDPLDNNNKKTKYCLIRINKTKFVTSGLRKEMRIWESWFPRRGRSPAPWVGSRGPSSSRHWLKTIFWSILVQVKILNWLKCFEFKNKGTYVIYSFFFRICSWNSSRLYTVGYRGGEDVS